MTNKFMQKSWGSEVVWAADDSYVAKTVEIDAGKMTDIIVHTKYKRDILVITGKLYLLLGSCCDETPVEMHVIPEGWSWHIPAGLLYRYESDGNPVRLIEISSPAGENDIVIVDEKDIIRRGVKE